MRRFCHVTLALMVISATVAHADVKLPRVLDSRMVMQRDVPLTIWGWAEPGERVSVSLGKETQQATAGKGKLWHVTLKPQKADGQARTITIQGKNKIVLSDILIGEVWIGSGQSNMEWQLRSTQGAKAAINAADHPKIRLFHVPKVQKGAPAPDVNANWKVCTPKNIPAFSAVLYYFGRELHKKLGVPIGLINSSWGGSPIEPWIAGTGGSGMYNGMIAPLTRYAVRGSLWYQGETNVIQRNGFKYYKKKQDLIGGWRKAFKNDNLAFYFVQIAPWSRNPYRKGQLPALWEAQVATLKVKGTGMVVTTDLVDNINDIHPRNKLDVGKRLALWALAKTYGMKSIVYSGPLYKSMKVEGRKIRLMFAHTAKGLKSRDGKPLSEFQIAGKDGKFVKAKAEIDGKTIVVSAKGVTSPAQVQFGWHKTANPNLVNSAGLPASPFRTRNWRGGTGE